MTKGKTNIFKIEGDIAKKSSRTKLDRYLKLLAALKFLKIFKPEILWE
jgi:hypothetical protein